MGPRDVQLVDVSAADQCGRCVVSVYDEPDNKAYDVRVCYLPDVDVVEIEATCPWERHGFRVCIFVEGDTEVRDTVAARVREAARDYDPR